MWIRKGHEKFIPVWIKRTRWRPKKKVFYSKISTNIKRSSVRKFPQTLVVVSKFLRFFTNSQVKTKKKGLRPKSCIKFCVGPQKYGRKTPFFSAIAPSLLISSGQFSLEGGQIFVWGGTSSDLAEHGHGMPPMVPGLPISTKNLPISRFS